MAAPRQIIRQRDFSGGEIVPHAKRRDDEAIVRSAARTLRNVRILSSGAVEQRPGRAALFKETGRVDKVRMSPTYSAYLCFGDGKLTIRNSAGAVVAQGWSYAWTAATSDDVTLAQVDNDIVMTFDGQVPKIARWDGGTEWTLLDWAAATTSIGAKRVPFYRIADKDITMSPSGRTGTVTLTFSAAAASINHIGTVMRFVNRQILITSYGSATSLIGLVRETLPGSQVLTFGVDPRSFYALGDIVEGTSTESKGYVTASNATTITVQLITTGTTSSVVRAADRPGIGDKQVGDVIASSDSISAGFTTSDTVVGPGGGLIPSSVAAVGNPAAVPFWDEEVMNGFRGWPKSCSYDQGRLIFCDFPAVPEGIAYSALLGPEDFYPGAHAADAMFETAPKKARVYHVMEGSDQYVMTDRGVYYIPISEANPLKPGSVAFRRIPGSAASAVRPAITSHGLVYVNNGLNRVLAVVPTGQTAMPWQIRPVSDLHSHLFSGITCLAYDEGDGDPPDEMVYAVNGNGTVAVGRYQPGKEWVGWVLWQSTGAVKWVSALGADVTLSVSYSFGWITEAIDPDHYLDAAVTYNAIPAALATGAMADVLMPDDQGTNGGNMTAGGGVNAARDGTTSQAAAACATNATSAAFWFVRFGQPMRIAKAEVWGSNDQGFSTQATVTITLRGYNGGSDPTSTSDGTALGTTGAVTDDTLMRTITSNDETTSYDVAMITITAAAATQHLAEVRLYTPGANNGSGALWFIPSSTVDIMDGRRVVGTGTTDANGVLTATPAVTTQQVGLGFDVTIEPFMPHVAPGQRAEPAGQTMQKRQLAGVAVAVQNSTGFKVQSYNQNTAAWTTVNARSAYDADATATELAAEPPVREEVYIAKPQGNDYDPRIRILKDDGGPLRVLEISDDIGT